MVGKLDGTLDVHGQSLTVAGEAVWDLQEVAEGAHDELHRVAADADPSRAPQAGRPTHDAPA